MLVFLLTDIEQSTEKWEKYHGIMGALLARHDSILKEIVEKHGGRIVKHTGDGIFAVFEKGTALGCALDIQHRFGRENWGEIGELRIRIGLNAGTAEERGGDYFGAAINRAARIMEAAWGGQILVTEEVRQNCAMPLGAFLKDHGIHQLSGLDESPRIFELRHPDLPIKEFPPIHSLTAHPNNLPLPITPFLGREDEVARIIRDLEQKECRIVSIVGPGGIGKSRLAIEAAGSVLGDFPHGVYYVPLTSLVAGSIQFLVFTVADALKFSFYSREDPKIQLINHLREKTILLVLDNFEHLVGEAELIAEIVEDAPHIKCLITSRSRLQLKGEYLFELGGMPFPDTEKTDDAEQYPAIKLFVQSARRIKPDYILHPGDRDAVVRICRLVEGLPLGIELAASWVRSLSCPEIMQELEKSLGFLSSQLQDTPKRHKSLRAVFDHTWDLLSVEEKKIFKRLSIFQGGFSREAAKQIAGASLADLNALSDKSLVRRDQTGRYEVLKMLKQFTAEKLEINLEEREETQVQFCRFYAQLLDAPVTQADGNNTALLHETIAEEIENVRAAWQWAIDDGMFAEIDKMLPKIYSYYESRAWLQEGVKTFQMAMNRLEPAAQNDDHSAIINRLNSHIGALHQRLSQYAIARLLIENSMIAFKRLNRPKDISFCLNELGIIAYKQGQYEAALEYYASSKAIKETTGDKQGLASTINNQAIVYLALGNFAEARALHEQALALRTQLNDRFGMASSMNNLANVIVNSGEYNEAKRLYEKSLAIRQEIKDRTGIASCLNNLGLVYEKMGEDAKARGLYLESLKLKQDIGDMTGAVNSLSNLASLALKSKESDEAREYLRSGLEISMKLNAVPRIMEMLNSAATYYLRNDDKETAFLCAAVILSHPASTRELRIKVQEIFDQLKTELSIARVEEKLNLAAAAKLQDIVSNILIDLGVP
jgi:predicted ATPase/class 3 adenylate cyclase/Flp pilus assembly protein TadD